MNKTALSLLLASLLLGACVIVPMKTAFDESAFAPYGTPGTATITGQAFQKTRGGEVRYGAGNTVELAPATPYTTERYNNQRTGMAVMGVDPRLAQYVHTTVADANGNFEFHNLAPGMYYVTCNIVWEVPSQYGMMQTGGIACAVVTVKPGETVKVVVTGQ